jgi:gluconokinase
MGVSGVGKSTVGARLAERLEVPFADADSFHSPENVAKMSAGIPLSDTDRQPWLAAVGRWLAEHAASGAVTACSALHRSYRDTLRGAAPDVCFLHLVGADAVIGERVAHRPHHFMPASLLDSQLATLQPLEPDERGVAIDASLAVVTIVDTFVQELPGLLGVVDD